jgi:hypothetical protein
MENRLHTFKSGDGERAKPVDLVQSTLVLFRPWRPSRMKTGLRNRSIGRRVDVIVLRRYSGS